MGFYPRNRNRIVYGTVPTASIPKMTRDHAESVLKFIARKLDLNPEPILVWFSELEPEERAALSDRMRDQLHLPPRLGNPILETIVEIEGDIADSIFSFDAPVAGFFHRETGAVYVRKGLTGPALTRTLAHELIHAADHARGKPRLESKEEEVRTETYARHLARLYDAFNTPLEQAEREQLKQLREYGDGSVV